ncbi:Cupredoxin [Scheffersomyces amazonensis]|uniref:Cupredoxin n=1 Tax=Scheffersomyces amazonensis TaxID=1078765 RepID=UPI00315D6F44
MHFIYVIWLFIWAGIITAETHTFHFNVSYVTANPDGLLDRRMIGINNHWPNPTIRVKKNDRVEIYLTNFLENRNTSLHFHGLFQKDTNAMDGPEMVTQCPIPPGETFLYNFTVTDQVGTYWYHSHSGSQYGDGLRGVFIIEDDDYPFDFQQDSVLTVGEHYHKETPAIMKSFMSRYNPTGAEPIPQNILFNETNNVTWTLNPGETTLLRIVNVGLFVAHYIYIEDHTLTIVEIDGGYVEQVEVDSIYIAPGQRYSVLIQAKKSPQQNYRFICVLDYEMLDLIPSDLQLVSTNWVQYTNTKELPGSIGNDYKKIIESLHPAEEFNLIPLEKVPLYPEPDYTIELNFTMEVLGDGITYALFNGISYVPPKVPTLMTVLSGGEYSTVKEIYGSNTNSFVLQPNEVVEIILNNMDPGKHPFHLHGHTFQTIVKSKSGENEDEPLIYNPENATFPEYPMIRDTVQTNPNGHIVIRFKAENPGVWFFHCHVDWHLEQGLAITLIESPLITQEKQTLIDNHKNVCESAKIPVQGNAAGNFGSSKKSWLNLHGENVQFSPLPVGFTLKGYIAMALCTFVALYGVFSIYKYGMEDVNSDNIENKIEKLHKLLADCGETDESAMFNLNSNGEAVNQ